MENEKKEGRPILEVELSYSFGKEESKTALAQIREETLSLLPKFGEPIKLTFREILKVSEKDYHVFLDLVSKEKIILFDFGYKQEDFLRLLSKFRNQMLLEDLLMQETIKKAGVSAEFVSFDKTGKELQKGIAELRLYATSLVIIPERGEFLRIPYSDISTVNDENYQLIILKETGQKIILSKLGEQLDSFKEILSLRINELILEVQTLVKELYPKASVSVVRTASRLMREGKAVRKTAIESLSPELWSALEKKLEDFGAREEYDFLKSLAQVERISLGYKKGLMGSLSGDYIWFLIPIYSIDSKKPGNVIAMEATTEKGTGKATYFFRIMNRKDYKKIKSIEELHQKADELLKNISQAMIDINFRREPIYLTDEKLKDSQYDNYRFAIEKLPHLRMLRSLFIGRVMHSSFEQWKEDTMDLLQFNVLTEDDSQRWEKKEKVEREQEE